MLRWFERRLDPYPTAEPQQPPAKLLPFLLFYLQGSKRLLAPAILSLLPYDTCTLVEPFAGSAAVSIAARYAETTQQVWLGDLNAPLVELWREILAENVNALSEDTLRDALVSITTRSQREAP